jgi:peptide/nickel transport system substrate-binding protein
VTWKLKQGVHLARRQAVHRRRRRLHLGIRQRSGHGRRCRSVLPDVTVEKVDDHTVRVKFKKATPFWADTFVGGPACIIPKHLFADFIGAKSREAPTNLKPVGTGPYRFKDFKPGDLVTGEINTELSRTQSAAFRLRSR